MKHCETSSFDRSTLKIVIHSAYKQECLISCPITCIYKWNIRNSSSELCIRNIVLLLQLLEEDIAKREDKMQSLKELAENFRARKHFMSSELCSRANKIMDR